MKSSTNAGTIQLNEYLAGPVGDHWRLSASLVSMKINGAERHTHKNSELHQGTREPFRIAAFLLVVIVVLLLVAALLLIAKYSMDGLLLDQGEPQQSEQSQIMEPGTGK